MNIAEKPKRMIDCTMPFQRLECSSQQAFFKDLESLLWRSRFQ
jgi:hypothetical protein